jgi:hypothetical protein
MNINTLRDAITVTSSAHTTSFRPDDLFADDERYFAYFLREELTGLNPWFGKLYEIFTIQVDTTARDINGNRLQEPFQTRFIPEPYFRVRSIYSYSVWLNSPVSREMVAFISWTPNVAGEWLYLTREYSSTDSSYLYFRFHEQQLPESLVLNISDNLRDKYGNKLDRTYRQVIIPAAFEVEESPPRIQRLSESLVFGFTETIDPTTVANAVRISPPLSGAVKPKASGRSLIVEHERDFESFAEYRVTIDTSLRSIHSKRLQGRNVFSFITEGFTFSHSEPYNGELDVARDISLRFDFNERIDSLSFQVAFTVDPSVAGAFGSWAPGDRRIIFIPKDSLRPLTVYSATVATALRTIGGTPLSMPVVVTFKTGR